MPTYRANAFANFVGQLVTGLVTLSVIPLFLGLMGPAGYGVVALLLSIQASLTLLDLGLSVATNRELARARVPNSGSQPGNFFVSIEAVYWTTGGITGVLIACCAPLLMRMVDHTSGDALEALRWFGLLFAIRWPVIFYISVLRGLELQVTANLISGAHTVIRALSTLAVLSIGDPTPLTFVAVQTACSVFEVLQLRWRARREIRRLHPETARFAWSQVQSVWRFSLTATATSLVATLIKQSDKFLLAHFAGVQALAYYYAATEAGRAIQLFSTPLTNAAYPRFSTLHAQANMEGLKIFLLRVSQLTSFLVAGAVGIMAGLAGNLLWIWSQDLRFLREGTIPFALLTVGFGFNAMMQLPYSLQLATGQNRVNMLFLFGYLPVGLPLSYFAIRTWGGTGAAVMWVVFNIAYLCIVPPLMDRMVGFRFAGPWLAQTARPFLLAAAGSVMLMMFTPPTAGLLTTLGAALAFAMVYCAASYFWFLDRSLFVSPVKFMSSAHK